jgi:hypothetical protein
LEVDRELAIYETIAIGKIFPVPFACQQVKPLRAQPNDILKSLRDENE